MGSMSAPQVEVTHGCVNNRSEGRGGRPLTIVYEFALITCSLGELTLRLER